MLHKNIWFNLASHNNSGNGIRRGGDKLTNFNYVVPLFKAKKIYFPIDKVESVPMKVFKEQISLAMKNGFKGKDDFLDTVSMLPLMNAVRPSPNVVAKQDTTGIWNMPKQEYVTTLSSYIV